MGKAWARNIAASKECRLVGWVDIRPGAASAAAAELGYDDVECGDSLTEIIERSAPDFVVDVTVPEAHREVVTTALRLGFPVIGEKPMATSLAEAREMVHTSESTGKLYMVSQSRRYDGRIVAFRDAVRDRIGDLGILNVDFYIGAHFGGFRDEMESPLVLDMAIHTFDQARLISNSEAVSVYADEFNPTWSWYAGAASANAIFEMSNGLRFAYRGSWCAEGLGTSWEGNWRAVGALGTALWDGTGNPKVEVVRDSSEFLRNGEPEEVTAPEISSGIAGSLSEFLDALRTGNRPQGECHDNFKSLAMVFAAKESSRKGCKVQVETL
jgi:predicted dehydrogenase